MIRDAENEELELNSQVSTYLNEIHATSASLGDRLRMVSPIVGYYMVPDLGNISVWYEMRNLCGHIIL